MKPRIVVDAMGGDNAPQEIVAGALMAAGGLDVELFLVGKTKAIVLVLSQLHICLINFLAKDDCLPKGGFPIKCKLD